MQCMESKWPGPSERHWNGWVTFTGVLVNISTNAYFFLKKNIMLCSYFQKNKEKTSAMSFELGVIVHWVRIQYNGSMSFTQAARGFWGWWVWWPWPVTSWWPHRGVRVRPDRCPRRSSWGDVDVGPKHILFRRPLLLKCLVATRQGKASRSSSCCTSW